MNIGYAIRDFFFPPTCPGCYDVFAAKYGEKNELCPDCEKKWELLKATVCRNCGDRFSSCRCVPKALEKAGVSCLIKLVPYCNKRAVSNNVVLYAKRRRDKRVFDFLADQLDYELERYVNKLGIRADSAIIAYCPRRRSAINKIGFDQARLLAEALEKRSGIACVRIIKRSFFGGRAQKKLDAKKRARNVKGVFFIDRNIDIKSKTVFLLDDLVTTGATMGECVKLLKKSGAALVVGICVAYTEKTE